jgi:L-threonylcarbamoyladenylate synthase
MGPRILEMWGDPPDPELITMVARHLESGGLVAMPTETVYGFGAALSEKAVKEIQRLKARGPEKPFLVLVPGMESVAGLTWTPQARDLAGTFWPGALTLVLEDPDGIFPPGVRSSLGTVAIRQSPHPLARRIVEALGQPLISTSANPPGGVPSLSAQEARDTAIALGAGADLWVLDGGPLDPSEASTVVDCTGAEPVVARDGSIPLNRLRCVLPGLAGPAPSRPSMRILFVCSGNTCRSPMAEVIARRESDVYGSGNLTFRSAGTSTVPGLPASEGALGAAERHGLSLGGHRSTPLSHDLVREADLILTMGPAHAHRVAELGGEGKVELLGTFAQAQEGISGDPSVPDPFGGDDNRYEATFLTLESYVRGVLERLAQKEGGR